MNILYHTYCKVCATKGGTERATISMASALTHNYGCRCFSLYEVEASTPKEDCFVNEFRYDVTPDWMDNIRRIREIIIGESINVLIVQGTFIYVNHFKEAVKGLDCKVVLAHHFRPGAEALFFTFSQHIKSWRECDTLRRKGSWLKNTLLYPRFQRLRINTLRRTYREAYQAADQTVVLCHGFIDEFQKYGAFHNAKKFTVIPNALSFEDSLSPVNIKDKKKIALIVARMDETYKRISLALRIWKIVKSYAESAGWHLRIVGEGPSLASYKELVTREDISDVVFLGRQDPVNHYRKASLFLMTSISESWGLTLTEAQQFGVVPLAFDTYESLSEIITDGCDGLIIPEGDIEGYSRALAFLMNDPSRREKMACAAIAASSRYAQSEIAKLWWDLFNSL